jgi:hypothetical protein
MITRETQFFSGYTKGLHVFVLGDKKFITTHLNNTLEDKKYLHKRSEPLVYIARIHTRETYTPLK